MRPGKIFFRLTLIILAGLAWAWLASAWVRSGPVQAASPTRQPTPTGPDRYTTMLVNFTQYEWWLVGREDNEINCAFWADHAGLPTDNDIISACGTSMYNVWKFKSPPCDKTDITSCKGFYLLPTRKRQAKKEVPVKLPAPEVFASIENCEPDLDGWCTTQPSLILTGSEPLPNESIIGIHGLAGTDPFTCKGDRCEFKLNETKPEGVRLTFWAYSTYGDSTEMYDALMRVVVEQGGERLTPRWHVDVLSSQWLGQPAASCSQVWETFPPTEGLPEWLTTPNNSYELRSNIPYAYLAGNLISQGVVNVSACKDKGLLPGGSASPCGLKAAKRVVEEWQNRFDDLIYQVAGDTEVPAQLLKNLFSRESQFWPGVFRNGGDIGLGQLTEGGADTALLWNPSFYRQFCPLVLDKQICETHIYSEGIKGDTYHPALSAKQRALLRGALVHSVDASCDNCPLGLDLSRADFSVGIFAHTLLANCEQAGNIIRKVTGDAPGVSASYEDMWRFTLINYNAGPGCLADAMQAAYDSGAFPLDWNTVSSNLSEGCQGAISYVDDISKLVSDSGATAGEGAPTPTP
jgi:hypothetical protein